MPEKTMKDPPAVKLLPRLGRQLIKHAQLVSVLCYSAGFVTVLLLPLLAKNTYISENALMPGSANPAFGQSDILEARGSAAEVKALLSQEQDGGRAVSRWLINKLAAVGADCYLHPFFPPSPASSTNFPAAPSEHFKWTMSNISSIDRQEKQRLPAVNTVGIVRAPQGEGNEAIVLVTPFDAENCGQEGALSLGVGFALFTRLSKALWMARDVIWLVADSKYGAHHSVAEWLKEYHEPSFGHFALNARIKSDIAKDLLLEDGQSNDLFLSDFKRAGTIATGLVFELKIVPGAPGDSLTLRAEGPNGQMPNLDLINTINSISVWRESLSLKLDVLPSLRQSGWLSHVGKILEGISDLTRQINPSWGFALPVGVYHNALATLLSSMFFQVNGLPTGAHGAFRDYQIDAVSLQFPVSETVTDYTLTKFGRVLEGVLRSVNNLLEKWHQSFFLYFLSAPHRYISVGIYMVPFALLLVSLPLGAVALSFHANQDKKLTKDLTGGSVTREKSTQIKELGSEGSSAVDNYWTWLQALILVSMVHVWAVFITVTLTFISGMEFSPEVKCFGWLVIVAVSLKGSLGLHMLFSNRFNSPVALPRKGHTQLWVIVKSLTLGVAGISLAVMSTINYPVALLGTLIMVPMCLGVFPLQYSWNYFRRPGKSVLTFIPFAVGTLLTILGSPLGLSGLVGILCDHLWKLTPGNFWHLMESLLVWRSALFPYLLVIHLPCSVLCMYILFSTDPPNLI